MTASLTDRGPSHRPPCVFWVLLPVIILLLFSLAASFEYMPQVGKVVSVGVGATGVVLLLAAYDAVRFSWAIRALGAIVFIAYALYLVAELREGHGFRTNQPRSAASPTNALLGLIFFGIPGLLIALRPTKKRTLLEVVAPGAEIKDDRDGNGNGA